MSESQTPGKYGQLARKIRGGESKLAIAAQSESPLIVITRRLNKTGLLGRIAIIRTLIDFANAADLTVEVDGQQMATLKEGQTQKTKLSEGEHSIRICGHSFNSKPIIVNLKNGTIQKFWCEASSGGVTFRKSSF